MIAYGSLLALTITFTTCFHQLTATLHNGGSFGGQLEIDGGGLNLLGGGHSGQYHYEKSSSFSVGSGGGGSSGITGGSYGYGSHGHSGRLSGGLGLTHIHSVGHTDADCSSKEDLIYGQSADSQEFGGYGSHGHSVGGYHHSGGSSLFESSAGQTGSSGRFTSGHSVIGGNSHNLGGGLHSGHSIGSSFDSYSGGSSLGQDDYSQQTVDGSHDLDSVIGLGHGSSLHSFGRGSSSNQGSSSGRFSGTGGYSHSVYSTSGSHNSGGGLSGEHFAGSSGHLAGGPHHLGQFGSGETSDQAKVTGLSAGSSLGTHGTGFSSSHSSSGHVSQLEDFLGQKIDSDEEDTRESFLGTGGYSHSHQQYGGTHGTGSIGQGISRESHYGGSFGSGVTGDHSNSIGLSAGSSLSTHGRGFSTSHSTSSGDATESEDFLGQKVDSDEEEKTQKFFLGTGSSSQSVQKYGGTYGTGLVDQSITSESNHGGAFGSGATGHSFNVIGLSSGSSLSTHGGGSSTSHTSSSGHATDTEDFLGQQIDSEEEEKTQKFFLGTGSSSQSVQKYGGTHGTGSIDQGISRESHYGGAFGSGVTGDHSNAIGLSAGSSLNTHGGGSLTSHTSSSGHATDTEDFLGQKIDSDEDEKTQKFFLGTGGSSQSVQKYGGTHGTGFSSSRGSSSGHDTDLEGFLGQKIDSDEDTAKYLGTGSSTHGGQSHGRSHVSVYGHQTGGSSHQGTLNSGLSGLHSTGISGGNARVTDDVDDSQKQVETSFEDFADITTGHISKVISLPLSHTVSGSLDQKSSSEGEGGLSGEFSSGKTSSTHSSSFSSSHSTSSSSKSEFSRTSQFSSQSGGSQTFGLNGNKNIGGSHTRVIGEYDTSSGGSVFGSGDQASSGLGSQSQNKHHLSSSSGIELGSDAESNIKKDASTGVDITVGGDHSGVLDFIAAEKAHTGSIVGHSTEFEISGNGNKKVSLFGEQSSSPSGGYGKSGGSSRTIHSFSSSTNNHAGSPSSGIRGSGSFTGTHSSSLGGSRGHSGKSEIEILGSSNGYGDIGQTQSEDYSGEFRDGLTNKIEKGFGAGSSHTGRDFTRDHVGGQGGVVKQYTIVTEREYSGELGANGGGYGGHSGSGILSGSNKHSSGFSTVITTGHGSGSTGGLLLGGDRKHSGGFSSETSNSYSTHSEGGSLNGILGGGRLHTSGFTGQLNTEHEGSLLGGLLHGGGFSGEISTGRGSGSAGTYGSHSSHSEGGGGLFGGEVGIKKTHSGSFSSHSSSSSSSGGGYGSHSSGFQLSGGF